MSEDKIPFSIPSLTGREQEFVLEVLEGGALSGNGPMTEACHQWFRHRYASRSLLTHSCTGALEMAALLVGLKSGDEFIVPSYTFVTSASSFALRGAKPVFADISRETLNIDASTIDGLVTERTRLIVPVHYAGVSCEMDAIMEVANRHDLWVVEDAAQAIEALDESSSLVGTRGHLSAFSFHNTKNVVAGEGGALLVNGSPTEDVEAIWRRAEMIWEKGTDRASFVRGETDKYTWRELGSSFLPSELNAAVLRAQLERAKEITQRRLSIWNAYFEAFEGLESIGITRPHIRLGVQHNAHCFYLIFPTSELKEIVREGLGNLGISSVSHYAALHQSPYGRPRHDGRELPNTDWVVDRILRLPLFPDLESSQVDRVIDSVITLAKEFANIRGAK